MGWLEPRPARWRWWNVAWVVGVLAVLTLAGVGAVGSYRWARAKWGPEPPTPAPELARPVGPGKLTPADIATQILGLSPEERAQLEADFGLEPPKPVPAASIREPAGRATRPAGGSAPEPPPPVPSIFPKYLVRAEFGPGPRGDTGEGLCYVPEEGAQVDLRIRWTSPAQTLAEAAGCAAADTAEKVEEVAAKVDAKLERVLGFKLDAELRAELRAGIGYGSGGPGALLMGSLGGFQTGPIGWRADGIAWISADPAIAVAITGGTTWAPGDK